jgi:DNA (cytosine-5)-methyltransferase 1
MSWLYSQALVAEYLGENFSDGEQSAPLSGNHIQQAYCAPDKMTVFSRLSRFGMTYKPLTESRGGIVDVVSGGFPCQDISAAGKGEGIDGERSGMWGEMARIIHEVRPKFVFVENSPMLTSRGLGRVLGDLASMGFDARWGVLGAADVGANHQRDRIWIVGTNLANTKELLGNGGNDNARISMERKAQPKFGNDCGQGSISNANGSQRQGVQQSKRKEQEYTFACNSRWWEVEPDVGRMADGVAAGMDRLKAIGNGQVPLCAATAWRILSS